MGKGLSPERTERTNRLGEAYRTLKWFQDRMEAIKKDPVIDPVTGKAYNMPDPINLETVLLDLIDEIIDVDEVAFAANIKADTALVRAEEAIEKSASARMGSYLVGKI